MAEIFTVKANEEVEGSFKLRELVGIDFENSDLIKGIEIRVDVPEPVMEFRESFLFRIFSNLDEDPDNSIKYYYGNEVLKKTFPKDRTLDVAIPLSGDDVWAPDSLGVTTVDPPISREQFPLLLTIEPEMKGIPQRVSEAPFEFTVKPVLYDRGKLSLILPEDSNEEELTVEIDGDTFSPTKDMYTLKTGIHELTVSSPSTNPFSTTFGIEQGEITKIKAELEPARSYISFEAPEGAEVYFNGKKIEKEDHRNFTAEPGEHVVLVKLDDYSLSKNFQLKRGKNYKISLFFDILVEED
ncbi:MAG: PEGA domain-containing protein [Spirochaetia bacterium]